MPGSVRSAGSVGPVRFMDKPFSMNLMSGVGTVVGGFGAVLEYNVARRFALGAGMGASWFGPGSVLGPLQGGGFGRFRFLVSEDNERAQAFGAVAGFSTGHFNSPLFASDEPLSEQAYWTQLGLDYELVTRGGFRFAGGAGAAILVGTSDVQGREVDQSKLPRLVLAIDLSVGYAF